MIFLLSFAFANPFPKKSMTGDWAVRSIDRNWVLPKGLTELNTSISSKVSWGYRDAQGVFQPYEEARWHYNQFRVRYAHGLSRHITLQLDIPWVWSILQTTDAEWIDTFALGDVQTRILVQPWTSKRSTTALGLTLKSPSGVEWPASGRDGPNDIQGFLTGTGVTNLGAELRTQWKPTRSYATRISGGYTLKIPAVVGYVIEEGGFGNGILDPGDEIWATWTHFMQVHERVSFSVEGQYSWRGSYRIGSSGAGLGMENPEELMASTQFLDVQGGLYIEPSPLFSVGLLAEYQLLGSDTRTFAALGLEEFSPQPGWTATLEGAIRW